MKSFFYKYKIFFLAPVLTSNTLWNIDMSQMFEVTKIIANSGLYFYNKQNSQLTLIRSLKKKKKTCFLRKNSMQLDHCIEL